MSQNRTDAITEHKKELKCSAFQKKKKKKNESKRKFCNGHAIANSSGNADADMPIPNDQMTN